MHVVYALKLCMLKEYVCTLTPRRLAPFTPYMYRAEIVLRLRVSCLSERPVNTTRVCPPHRHAQAYLTTHCPLSQPTATSLETILSDVFPPQPPTTHSHSLSMRRCWMGSVFAGPSSCGARLPPPPRQSAEKHHSQDHFLNPQGAPSQEPILNLQGTPRQDLILQVAPQ